MKIAIGCDHAGFALKAAVLDELRARDVEVIDCGTDGTARCDYPDFAVKVAGLVAGGGADRGVLMCGTGLGMSMAANRHVGVRAALCHDAYTAEMARRHNDANVLCMGARAVGGGVAEQMARIFVETPFDGDRHQRRVTKIEREEP